MKELAAYLTAAAQTRWRDGVHDCSAWPAGWAGIALPPYSSASEARAMVEEAGGLVPLWERVIGGSLERVETPEPGDVGIIEALGSGGTTIEVGAIWTGERWAFVAPRGLVSTPAEALAIWRRPCPKR